MGHLSTTITGRPLGAWRWLIQTDQFFTCAAVATAFSVDPDRARHGLPFSEFSAKVHHLDRIAFNREVERAVVYGGTFEINFRIARGAMPPLWVSGLGHCVQGSAGRPVEYLGTILSVATDDDMVPVLDRTADLLIAAAGVLRESGEKDLRFFVDMALVQLGDLLSASKKTRHLRIHHNDPNAVDGRAEAILDAIKAVRGKRPADIVRELVFCIAEHRHLEPSLQRNGRMLFILEEALRDLAQRMERGA